MSLTSVRSLLTTPGMERSTTVYVDDILPKPSDVPNPPSEGPRDAFPRSVRKPTVAGAGRRDGAEPTISTRTLAFSFMPDVEASVASVPAAQTKVPPCAAAMPSLTPTLPFAFALLPPPPVPAAQLARAQVEEEGLATTHRQPAVTLSETSVVLQASASTPRVFIPPPAPLMAARNSSSFMGFDPAWHVHVVVFFTVVLTGLGISLVMSLPPP